MSGAARSTLVEKLFERTRIARFADALAIASAATLPWSVTLSSIAIALWFFAVWPTLDWTGLAPEPLHPCRRAAGAVGTPRDRRHGVVGRRPWRAIRQHQDFRAPRGHRAAVRAIPALGARAVGGRCLCGVLHAAARRVVAAVVCPGARLVRNKAARCSGQGLHHPERRISDLRVRAGASVAGCLAPYVSGHCRSRLVCSRSYSSPTSHTSPSGRATLVALVALLLLFVFQRFGWRQAFGIGDARNRGLCRGLDVVALPADARTRRRPGNPRLSDQQRRNVIRISPRILDPLDRHRLAGADHRARHRLAARSIPACRGRAARESPRR